MSINAKKGSVASSFLLRTLMTLEAERLCPKECPFANICDKRAPIKNLSYTLLSLHIYVYIYVQHGYVYI